MHLYNSRSRKIEKFEPLDKETVKMYVCGITPYDTTHLGHAFTYVSFDILKRYLEYKGYKVIYTQNVTDIDNDILKKAKETNKDWKKLGEFWTNKFLNDMKMLNVLKPTFYVKATDSIHLIIEITKNLIEKGYAYEKSGNVYFDIEKFKEYGKLSHYSHHQMTLLSKQRGGYPDDPLKKHPLDFVLWQKSKENEPYWESPWGKGRPGWHIECSAMINQYLGQQIDIHGGGRDLIFPHHESEIAQSESFINKKPFVKYWLHTGMVLYEGEKMAKSLGNLAMVSDLLKRYTPSDIRLMLISNHYRKPWEYDEKMIIESRRLMNFIENALKISADKKKPKISDIYLKQFVRYMNNDLDTPNAIKTIYCLAKRILKEAKNSDVSNLQTTLKSILSVLGFELFIV
ncbi:MAG: cysteine--tRNA ligase [Patescibacteria group bacterium]|nr:cysteine--tRNA ligase [Patescibacteria group bacterium]